MSSQYIPSISEGAYWVRNKSTKLTFGPGSVPSGGSTLLVGQDQHPLRQALTDQSQMWLVEPLSDGRRFRIRNAQRGFLLDVSESSTADGASVILYTPTGNPNQDWTIERVDSSGGGAYHRIVNVNANKCLTQTSTCGNAIVSSTWVDGDHQRWSFEPVVFPPTYWISHAETGWYLQYDKSGGATVGTKISGIADTRSQLWFLESRTDNDAYVIRSAEDDRKVLDLCGSDVKPGTAVIAYPFHGKANQQWVIKDTVTSNPGEDRVKIFSELAHTVIQVRQASGSPTSGMLQAQTDKGDLSQSWRLHQYPFVPVYWTTIQNLKTGTFLKQTGIVVGPSSGATSALDFSVQWRFVPDRTQPHLYRIINRATGCVVLGKCSSPSVAAAEQSQVWGDLWAIERAGQGIAIVNTLTGGALDHCDGGSTLGALPCNGTADPHRQWVTVQVSDRVPSFALVNSRTGRSLTFKSSSAEQGVTTTPGAVDDWSNQWHLENLSGLDGTDSPNYGIVSKVSGTVLDHYYAERIEAYSDVVNHPYHQWQIIPSSCGERYFQVVNVATGRLLEERETGTPNANATNLTDCDRAQCWELVSARLGDFDLITADDDVLQLLFPYVRPDIASELGRHILQRAPGLEKKGSRKDAHIPKNSRLLQDVAAEITGALEYAIGKWTDDSLQPLDVQAGTRVSVTRSELEANTHLMLPRDLRPGSNVPGWIRIDIEGIYESSPGLRVANLKGWWNNQSVFNVVVPIGAAIGRQIIQDAMRLSLRQHTSVIVEPTNSKPGDGGAKPGTKPAPPPGPAGAHGNGWVFSAAALTPVLVSSSLEL
ncbi:carbohydrate-binding module family 13 protein [Gelatoporia subvermispora B]|uniref:Carbohydrate-binding module family 13 protein n=1 Tax=Ceriporiopsis subvermispora (strain B) TaxID=914234 RepID=M2QQB0_CERS8|nr:carbohydrate-binding module family 13 protein [Gelatoporia subvermispora B]